MKKPKKKEVLVVEHPKALKVGKLYEGVIRSINVDKKSRSLHVTIENLDSTQFSRIHEIPLPTALFPGNKTARFLTAAGQDANTVGNRIDLDNGIVGVVVGMRFGDSDGSDKEIEFERVECHRDINADVSAEQSRDEQVESDSSLSGIESF